MEKKFELISSMMKRLGISPRTVILHCINSNQLSLNLILKDKEAAISFVTSHSRDKPEIGEKCLIKGADDVQTFENKIIMESEKTFEELFYAPIDGVIPEEFEFSAKTQNITRCGMFVYGNGDSFLLRKTPMKSKQQKRDSWAFKGILFASEENSILAIKFGDEYCNYKRAVKKLNTGYRLPNERDCEILFIYVDKICGAFKMLHTNL